MLGYIIFYSTQLPMNGLAAYVSLNTFSCLLLYASGTPVSLNYGNYLL